MVDEMQSTALMVKVNGLTNWTGLDEMPFEPIAERMLEIEAEGEKGALSVTFAKPQDLGDKGWACLFRMDAMGRVHVAPARGVDAVDALQQAFAAAHKQLQGMKRMHVITFGGGDELGFAPVGADAAVKTGGKCPVMNGAMSL